MKHDKVLYLPFRVIVDATLTELGLSRCATGFYSVRNSVQLWSHDCITLIVGMAFQSNLMQMRTSQENRWVINQSARKYWSLSVKKLQANPCPNCLPCLTVTFVRSVADKFAKVLAEFTEFQEN